MATIYVWLNNVDFDFSIDRFLLPVDYTSSAKVSATTGALLPLYFSLTCLYNCAGILDVKAAGFISGLIQSKYPFAQA